MKANPRYNREARANLTDVQDRIQAADNENDTQAYQARQDS